MNAYRESDDEEEAWDDDGAEFDADEPDEEPTVPCPYCRREIPEDAPRCPYCEHYVSAEDHARRSKPPWVMATALICLGVVVWWLCSAFGSPFR